MIVRKFILHNSNGNSIDFLDNLDIFAINPTGLGVSFNNDLVRSGSSFLINETSLEHGSFEVSILFGADSGNAYQHYESLITLLAYPPYTLEYVTEIGSWKREAILSDLSKTELNALDILAESFKLDCLTPWFQWKEDVVLPQPDQQGDGKIYNKHTNWKYAVDAYQTPPSSYSAKEFWDYKDYQPYIGKNFIHNNSQTIQVISKTTSPTVVYFTQGRTLGRSTTSIKGAFYIDATNATVDYDCYMTIGGNKSNVIKVRPGMQYYAVMQVRVPTEMTYIEFLNAKISYFVKPLTTPAERDIVLVSDLYLTYLDLIGSKYNTAKFNATDGYS